MNSRFFSKLLFVALSCIFSVWFIVTSSSAESVSPPPLSEANVHDGVKTWNHRLIYNSQEFDDTEMTGYGYNLSFSLFK